MLVVRMCFQLWWLNKGFAEISVFCHRARGLVWMGCVPSGQLCCFPLGFWQWAISKLLLRSSYTQKRKRGGTGFSWVFCPVVVSVTLLTLLLIFHCSDGELNPVHYFYGTVLKQQKADELANKSPAVFDLYCADDKIGMSFVLSEPCFLWASSG